MSTTTRGGVRFGSFALIAALAPMAALAGGCGTAKELEEGLRSLENIVTVCDSATKLRDSQYRKVQEAVATLSLAKPGDRAAISAFKNVARTEFTALHSGLRDQIAKAEDQALKNALTQYDAEVARWAANPEAWVKLDSAKRDAATAQLNKVCEEPE